MFDQKHVKSKDLMKRLEPRVANKSSTGWLFIAYRALTSRSRWKKEGRIILSHIHIVIIAVIAQWFHAAAASYAYFRHVPSPPLRDLGFDLIPEIQDPFRDISDNICLGIVFLGIAASLIPFFYNPTPLYWASLFLRIILNMTLATPLRCACFLSTGLPGPAPHCQPGSTEYDPPPSIYHVFFKGGGQQTLFSNCGDLMFSGHVTLSMIFVLCFNRYLPMGIDQGISKVLVYGLVYGLLWPLLMLQCVLIIGARKHYTVDVVVALFTTPFLWNASYSIFPEMKMSDKIEISNSEHGGDSVDIVKMKKCANGSSDCQSHKNMNRFGVTIRM